jgi:hypothetical protein
MERALRGWIELDGKLPFMGKLESVYLIQNRNPTWEEQRDARYELCPADIYMVQILPPKSEYVNIHQFCFHWYEAGPKFFDVATGRPLP